MANTSKWLACFLIVSLISYNCAFKEFMPRSLDRSRQDDVEGSEALLKRGCIGWARHKRKCSRGRKRTQKPLFNDQRDFNEDKMEGPEEVLGLESEDEIKFSP